MKAKTEICLFLLIGIAFANKNQNLKAAIFSDFPPFWMQFSHDVVHAGGQIDRDIDVDFFAGLDLLAKQVGLQVWVLLSHLCVVVGPTVMTAAETGDGVHGRLFQRVLPVGFVKGLADSGNGG